jgi:hypothetical protein
MKIKMAPSTPSMASLLSGSSQGNAHPRAVPHRLQKLLAQIGKELNPHPIVIPANAGIQGCQGGI